MASYPIQELVKALFDSNYSQMIEEPNEVRLQFRSGDICENDPAFFSDVWETALFTAGNLIFAMLSNPVLWPIYTTQAIIWSLTNCAGPVACCEPVDGPVIIEIPNTTIRKIWEKLDEHDVPLNANGVGVYAIPTGDLSFKIDGIPHDLPLYSPIPLTEKFVDDDNVHILHELAIIGNLWTPEYIASNSYQSALVHLPMMHDVLNEDGVMSSTTNSQQYYRELFELAPCIGPWADPHDVNHVAQEWASANRLFQPGNRNSGALAIDEINNNPGEEPDDPDDTPTLVIGPDPEYRGYFPGIDYMVIYNLYHMLWKEELPEYKRNLSCECISEITNNNIITSNLTVTAKFPSYRDMGIPIESFLAHSILVDGATIDVKNDLIICREDPELVTSLQLSNEANLVLFGGNTIEVREGNMIVLNNAKLSGAIIDPTDPTYTESTIHFKAGAEFHILNGSELILGGGLTIIMDEGSKLIIDASDVTALESLYSNHFIIHGEETVVQLHNNSHYQSSAPVHWEFTDNASLSIRNSLVQSNQDHWSFHNQCSVSISHNSQCYFVNSTQDMTANGTWVIDNSYFDISAAELNINTGSELHTNSTSFIIRNGGQLSIKNVFPNQQASHYYFDESTDLQIKGSESKLVFHGGKLHIPDNQIFTFTYPNAESGFIEVLAGTENMLHTGNNSVFLLVGEGSEDLMLRIAPGAHIQNPNFSAGSMIFRDALVDMEGGAIYTDMFFKAVGVNFISAGSSGNMWVWYSQAFMENCRFQKVNYMGMWSKFVVKHCRHFDMEFHLYGGGYDFCNNSYTNSDGQSVKLQLASVMLDCSFNGSQSEFYIDESLVEVNLRECTFVGESDNVGVSKLYGKLSLRCCRFEDCAIAIHAQQASVINMSLTDNAGSNKFINCGTMVLLDDAYDLDVYRGANDFSDVVDKIFSGNIIAYDCDLIGSEECEMELDALYNTWPGGAGPPGYPLINILGEGGSPCPSSSYPDCSLVVIDNSPALPQDCGSNKPIIDIHKSNTAGALISGGPANKPHNSGLAKNLQGSNPYLNTAFFQGVPLDSALVYAAGLSSIVDSLGNDSLAIELFHQILTAGLDRTNAEIRWKMLWGLRNMKTATEQLIIHGIITPENNTSIFHPIVQQYVDVLNLMTDDEIVDSTYKEQFYFELNKGQLFRSIANPWMALEIFDQLDQCDLDLPEQALLNQIIAEVNGEIATLQNYETGIALDSLIFLPDSTGMIIPQPYAGLNYFFGAYLVSPTEVYYMACEPQNRNSAGHRAHMQVAVYPNPNNGQFAMIYEGEEGPCQLSINDSFGRLVYSDQNPLLKNERRQIHLNQSMATGIYFLELKTLQGVYRKQMMISN